MKNIVYYIIVAVIVAFVLCISIFIYQMPYPLKTYYEYKTEGPFIGKGINVNDYKLMWNSINNRISFFELPIYVEKKEDGSIIIKTLTEKDGKTKKGKSYRFTYDGASWVSPRNQSGGRWALSSYN